MALYIVNQYILVRAASAQDAVELAQCYCHGPDASAQEIIPNGPSLVIMECDRGTEPEANEILQVERGPIVAKIREKK